jgi:hypothetical protein
MADDKPMCERCRFWAGSHYTPRAECRRDSPSTAPMVPWPYTDATDWCGQYESKVSSPPKEGQAK